MVASSVLILTWPATAVAQGDTGRKAGSQQAGRWQLSRGQLPISVDRMRGFKLDSHRVMWLGQSTEDAADNRRTFVYDIRTRTFREAAPLPAAKNSTDDDFGLVGFASVGVLADGSVVVAGGQVTDNPARNAENVLSYRYYPREDRWVRTGDLPEPQEWVGEATTLLPDGRLLAAGGRGLDALASGIASVRAFVYDPERRTSVAEIDPATGRQTGRTVTVRGGWDYTRTHNGRESRMSEPHYFGNEVRLHDGRILVTGGHALWKSSPGDGSSVLATHTDFFDPATGAWTQGPPLPSITGEDDQISNSHGGRTNGTCVTTLTNGKVLIAGGNTQPDNTVYFDTNVGRQSIVVMTPAADARKSRYDVSANPIPAGTNSGGLFGGPGRNQLLCYAISGGRALVAGGQTELGEDLYDSYVFNSRGSTISRGPDLVHGLAKWAGLPEFGYPSDYQTVPVSTREVATANSLLVFPGDVLVHGGGYDGIPIDAVGSTYVEQLNGL